MNTPDPLAIAPVLQHHFGVVRASGRMLALLHAARGRIVPWPEIMDRLGTTKPTVWSAATDLHDTLPRGSLMAIAKVGYRLTDIGMAACREALAATPPEPPRPAEPPRTPARFVANDFWTDERVEILRAGIAAGDSYATIARAIGHGCTRNATLGKAHRMGLAARKTAAPSKVPSPRGVRTPAPKSERPRVFIAGKNQVRIVKEAPPPKVEIKVSAFEPIPGSTPRPWMERTLSMCCWPVGGEGESTLYCCEPVHKRGWCAHHHGRGTVPLPAKKPTKGPDLYRSLRKYVA